MRAEGARCGAAVDELQDGRLDLEVALRVEHLADRAGGPRPQPDHVAGLLTHDEVGVALTHPRLLGEVLVQGRHRPQGLRRHLPGRRHDRQLTALAADDPPFDGDVIAEVDQGLPVGEGRLTHFGEAEHDLQPRPGPLLEGREAELARVADVHHPARRADHGIGLLSGLKVPPVPAQVAEAVGPVHPHRVCRVPTGDEPVALVPADPELFWEVVDLVARADGIGRHGLVGGDAGHRSRVPSPTMPPRRPSAQRNGFSAKALRIGRLRVHTIS